MMSRQRLTVFLTASFVVLALAAAGCGGGGSADKVTCAVDANCDADEVCSAGRCIARPDPCTSNSDCAADEVCTNGNCV